jgi:beta-fructofuranosidase
MPDHRPLAHLRPETGWTNDPVGPIRWQGRVHLFHQANPDGGYWHRPRWGHFVSDDLVRWSRRPIALAPDDEGPDRDGCFSGSVVEQDGTAVLFYTGAHGALGPDQAQVTCVARATDADLDHWVKDPTNPVTTPPPGLPLRGFRDPFVWHDDDGWHQLVGAGLDEGVGAALHVTSPDLRTWRHEGPLLTGAELADQVAGAEWTGTMWECPLLLRTEAGDVLLVNVHDDEVTHHTIAIVGTLRAGRFEPRRVQRFDHGPDVYAPCLLVEPDGRAVVWAWSWEAWSEQRQRQAGWAGVLTLPRRLTVEDDRLVVEPLPELERLREEELAVRRRPTPTGWIAEGVRGDLLDLRVDVAPACGPVEVAVRRAEDRSECTVVGVDTTEGLVWLDRDVASLDPQAPGGRHEVRVPVAADRPTELRIVVDRSIVEVFVAGVTLTGRIYPTRDDSIGVEVVQPAGRPDAVRLRAWPLRPVVDETPAGTTTP